MERNRKAIVKRLLAEGWARIRPTIRQKRLNISLDSGTFDAIDTAAQGRKLTRSACIAMATANQIRGVNR